MEPLRERICFKNIVGGTYKVIRIIVMGLSSVYPTQTVSHPRLVGDNRVRCSWSIALYASARVISIKEQLSRGELKNSLSISRRTVLSVARGAFTWCLELGSAKVSPSLSTRFNRWPLEDLHKRTADTETLINTSVNAVLRRVSVNARVERAWISSVVEF